MADVVIGIGGVDDGLCGLQASSCVLLLLDGCKTGFTRLSFVEDEIDSGVVTGAIEESVNAVDVERSVSVVGGIGTNGQLFS